MTDQLQNMMMMLMTMMSKAKKALPYKEITPSAGERRKPKEMTETRP